MSKDRSLERVGMSPEKRLALTTGFTLLWGLVLGARRGGQLASLQYLAEHAHKTPKTLEGWYLYRKRKNYHIMYWGIRRGFREGFRLAGWTALYGLLETGLDRLNASRAYGAHSVLAGLLTGGLFSLRYRLSRRVLLQALGMGSIFGGVCGLGQEVYLARQSRILMSTNAHEIEEEGSPSPRGDKDELHRQGNDVSHQEHEPSHPPSLPDHSDIKIQTEGEAR